MAFKGSGQTSTLYIVYSLYGFLFFGNCRASQRNLKNCNVVLRIDIHVVCNYSEYGLQVFVQSSIKLAHYKLKF